MIRDKNRNPKTSYVVEDKKAKSKEVPIVASVGSLILADVNGIHRGMPQKTKARSILYNNYFVRKGDLYPDY